MASGIFEALWASTREVHVGVAAPSQSPTAGGGQPEMVVVLRGSYPKGEMARWIGELPEAGAMLETRRYRGRRMLALEAARRDLQTLPEARRRLGRARGGPA